MHEPTYRQAIAHSWKLAWHHKTLWLFGMFAALLGQMGIMEILEKVSFPSVNNIAAGNMWWKFLFLGTANLSLSIEGWTWLVWLLILLGGMAILLIFAAVSSQGALINASAKWAKNNTLPDASKSWHAGTGHFWSLLILNILRKLILVFLAGLLSLFIYKFLVGAISGLEIFGFIILFLASTFIGLVVSFLAVYSAGYVVVENYPLSWALPAAWKMFKKHWLVSFEVGFIILVLNILVSLVAVFGLVLISVPTYLTWFITFVGTGNIFWILLSSLMPLLLLFFIVWLGSVFTVFVTSVWTYLFMKMHKTGLVSRIMHVFAK